VHDQHTLLNGILWILYAAAPWCDLLVRQGLWAHGSQLLSPLALGWGAERSFAAAQTQVGAKGRIDRKAYYIAGTIIRFDSLMFRVCKQAQAITIRRAPHMGVYIQGWRKPIRI
jgi:hypothetical protein